MPLSSLARRLTMVVTTPQHLWGVGRGRGGRQPRLVGCLIHWLIHVCVALRRAAFPMPISCERPSNHRGSDSTLTPKRREQGGGGRDSIATEVWGSADNDDGCTVVHPVPQNRILALSSFPPWACATADDSFGCASCESCVHELLEGLGCSTNGILRVPLVKGFVPMGEDLSEPWSPRTSETWKQCHLFGPGQSWAYKCW